MTAGLLLLECRCLPEERHFSKTVGEGDRLRLRERGSLTGTTGDLLSWKECPCRPFLWRSGEADLDHFLLLAIGETATSSRFEECLLGDGSLSSSVEKLLDTRLASFVFFLSLFLFFLLLDFFVGEGLGELQQCMPYLTHPLRDAQNIFIKLSGSHTLHMNHYRIRAICFI